MTDGGDGAAVDALRNLAKGLVDHLVFRSVPRAEGEEEVVEDFYGESAPALDVDGFASGSAREVLSSEALARDDWADVADLGIPRIADAASLFFLRIFRLRGGAKSRWVHQHC